ncbi:acyl-homoserine-lactone synthase [Mesorhizobium sp. L48C026A00]|uniref:acyl-homoserine-lactone synthase n=1 Tax=Mesorhizobium sp. L48C026A00 TaxID=1287182 RepID=UPI000A0EE08D|nr:acyl-homoserine-lactone synthase [Mesorhizobium sp. L48C026A00]
MIEAHVVTHQNRSLYDAEWDSYLRWRHEIYVHEKKWRPASPEGRELDQFDTPDATYILGFEDGELVTAARLIPTDKPHLVSEIFPHMCEIKGLPNRPDWAEWTRTFVVPDRRTAGRRGILTQICCAVMEFCLEEGLQYAGGIQETYFLPQWAMLNWRVAPLGLPQEVSGESCIVAYLECNESALAQVRRVLGIRHSLLIRRGEQSRFVDHTSVSPARFLRRRPYAGIQDTGATYGK